MSILLGAVADDFTGATDLCSTLVKEGMRVVQLTGLPRGQIDLGQAQAVVIALKSRTAPTAEAVQESLTATRWLREHGAQQIIFKVCSTFDSTDKGNIGPVADALQAELDSPVSVVCPAFPENGREVRGGVLYVNGLALADSPMRDHPLTPMRDSDLQRLMQAQSKGKVEKLALETVQSGSQAIQAALEQLALEGANYIVADATSVDELRAIGHALQAHRLVTGASGIARGLPDNFRRAGLLDAPVAAGMPKLQGRKLALAGSASTATRGQIAAVTERWPCRQLTLDEIADNSHLTAEIIDWLSSLPEDSPALVYGSGDPEQVRRNQQKYGAEKAGAMLEGCLSAIAVAARAAGTRKFIVAGGETSGAVVSALGVQALQICGEICPGVPWTQTIEADPLAIALKSGNFGGEDFFDRAFQVLP